MTLRIGRTISFLLALCAAVSVRAVVPVTLPVDPEESVVTCFSGLQFPQPSTTPYPADPSGFVVGIIDTRIPPLAGNPVPANDVNWAPQMFHNAAAAPQDVWNATNLGQVFGTVMDNATAPNIYVSATTVYGGSFAQGPGGPGAVYRLDGVTGSICLLTTLPNGGPALGQLAFDPNSNHLFISNMEDGLIYSLSLSNAAGGPPCGIGNWTTYDHGVQGRPNESLSVIPDAGTNNTFTAKGRRVWAVCAYQSRLYYSVWWEDSIFPTNATEDNEIWSVQIDGSGNLVPTTAIREFQVSHWAPNGGNSSGPVSDIEFAANGDMIVAERTCYGDVGGVDLGSNPAHGSRVLRYTGTSGSFVQLPDNTYRIGKLGSETNSAGGTTSDCDGNVWATADAIHYGPATGDTDYVYGLQRTLAAGNASDSTATVNAIIAALAPFVFKSQLGDVDYVRDCPIIGEGEGEGHPEGEGPCLTVSNDHADCVSDSTGTSITYTFDVTNNSGVTALWALFTSQTPGVTITPNQVATNIPNGGTQTFTLTFTGAQPGKPICFTITLLDETRKVCCSETICFENPCDCVIIPVDKQKIECDPTNPGSYAYTFYFTNTSTSTLDHMYLYPDGGGTFTPNYFFLGGVAPGATAGPFTVTLNGVTPGEYCFTLTFHDKELRECCAFRHCIDLPNCCKPDPTPPVITITGPTTVQCGQPGAYVITAIDDCDGDVSQTIKREGQVNWNANGTYCVTITAQDSSGNVASTTFCVTVTGCPDNPNGGGTPGAAAVHTADLNNDDTVQLSELLRVIQFYNAGGLHCDSLSEDGYAPGLPAGAETGPHHASDYIQPDWQIELFELLRLIQFYNAQGYHECPDGEDGYCVGKK